MSDKLFWPLTIVFVFGLVCIGIVIGYNVRPTPTVYMLHGVQEDDLFIPESSKGKVDLIGRQDLTH